MRKKSKAEGNLPLFPSDSSWKPPNVSDLPSWRDAEISAFDTEFWDPQLRALGCGARRGAWLAGYSFMLKGDEKAYYVSLRHPENNVENPIQGIRYLRDNFKCFKGRLLGANLPGDLDICTYETEGSDNGEGIVLDYNQVKITDIQILDPLIWEHHHSYSLENIAKRRKVPGKDKDLLKKVAQDYGYDVNKSGWEGCIAKLPGRYIGAYAEQDVRALYPIYDSQLKDIQEQNLTEVVELESKLLPLLLKMRQRGIRVDFNHLEYVERWTLEEEQRISDEIKHITGIEIGVNNCMAAARVAPALQAIGIEPDLTPTGLPSITTEALANIDHPLAEKIRYLRQVNKLRTTFVESVRKYQTNGRIHGTLRQVVGASEKNEKSGAAHGRLAHAHPNTSQQPSRGKLAPLWRKIYLPEEGHMLCSNDFSAQEPRFAAYFASLLRLPAAAPLAEEYRNNPRTDPHSALAKIVYGPDFTKDQRSIAKIIFLATSYSQGGSQLCKKQLKLPTRWKCQPERGKPMYFDHLHEAVAWRKTFIGKCTITEVAGKEGQAILDRFHEGAPWVKLLNRKVMEKVEATGFLKILGGRVLHFPTNERTGEYDFAYKALNRLIQSSAAYQTKIAMLMLDEQVPDLFKIHWQIHDELIGSITEMRSAKIVGDIMCNAVTNQYVPFRSEAEVGPNLGELAVVCNAPGCINFADPKDKWGCREHSLVAA